MIDHFVEKPLEIAPVGLQVGWVGVLRNHQGQVNGVARLMETQIWRMTGSSLGRGLRKGTVASASTSIWEKAAPPPLVFKARQFSSSLYGTFSSYSPTIGAQSKCV